MSQLGIAHIAAYIPGEKLDTVELATAFGRDSDFVENRIGARYLPQKGEDQKTSDIAVKALEKLCSETGLTKDDVDCVVLVTQNPDGRGLPHTSAIIQDKAGLPTSIPAFDISLGCSGYIYGLKIVQGFMSEIGIKNGVLITADPYSNIIDPEDGDTRMLFGDAATATLLSCDSAVLTVGKAMFGTDGSGAEYLQNKNDRLYMNGRQIFNFAATRVPTQVTELLEKEKLSMADIDMVIFHQGSKYIVETLARRLGVPDSKLALDIRETGNTISSSIPLLLKNYLNRDDVKTILASGFGVGLSWASALLYRTYK